VADGAAAQRALARGGFDLAIVDVNLPGQSGLEAIAATRALPDARAHVPVLAATAYVLRTKREEIYAAGADGILAKPIVSLVAFAEAVAAILPRSATVAAPAPEAMGDEADPAPRLAHLAEIAGPDGRLELLERLDADLRCASEGLDAAQTARDPARIRSHSHVLISLTGAVGAERLQAAMEALNCAAHDGEWSAIDRILAAAAAPLAALRCTISAQHARTLAAEGVEGTAAPAEPQARPA
jgi:CheY-like chemotaxis protein